MDMRWIGLGVMLQYYYPVLVLVKSAPSQPSCLPAVFQSLLVVFA